MIKFAVTRPIGRKESIDKGLLALDWAGDEYHRAYGLQINPNMIESKARILQAPSVEFRGGKTEKPGTNGRWRVDGKQFLRPNSEKLTRWAVCVFNHFSKVPSKATTPDEAKKFIRLFIDQFRNYGGNIEDKMPPIVTHADISQGVSLAYDRAKDGDRLPQLLVFLVNGKITHEYNRIKKNAECRFGIVSQVMQSAHVKACSLQYVGNVLMKVFAKLGGFAFRANPNQNVRPGPKPEDVRLLPPNSMIIGADVSHPGPGSMQPSMAALTASMDRGAMRFAAAVQTNGFRTEMITEWNWVEMFVPLLKEWMSTVGGGKFPAFIFYFRDGVSEGQYQQVLQEELRTLKHIVKTMDDSPGKSASAQVKWTVTIVSKRHHIRFFPKPGVGDKNGNAYPGTIVEKDVTHPHEYDFYLCSHSAIQGTARPAHYTVLVDESGMKTPDPFVKMIYNLCYQYARSSTPVSLIPAVYYAHLASQRALAHDRREVDDNFRYTNADLSDLHKLEEAKRICDVTGKMLTKPAVDRLRELRQMHVPPLLGMPEKGPDVNRIRSSMWFI